MLLNSRITNFHSLPEGADALLLGKIAGESKNGLLHVTLDDRRMATLSSCLKFFYPNLKIIEIPAWDCLPYDRVSPNAHLSSSRTEHLCELAGTKDFANTLIITTINSILQRDHRKAQLHKCRLSARKAAR